MMQNGPNPFDLPGIAEPVIRIIASDAPEPSPEPPRGSGVRSQESAPAIQRAQSADLPRDRAGWLELARAYLDGGGPTAAELAVWSIEDRKRLLHAVDLVMPERYGWTREQYNRLCRDARRIGQLVASIPPTPIGPDGAEQVTPGRYERWDVVVTSADKADLIRLARAHRLRGSHVVRAIMALMLGLYPARSERDQLLGGEGDGA